MFENDNYFEAILDHGTLSKAARALGVSQPALSGYLNKLEKKLGVTLFDRSTSPIVLTEAGSIYYKYLKQSESICENYQNEIRDLSGTKGGNVTIGGASSTTAAYLSRVTAEFLREYPGSCVRILDGVVSDIAKQALNGEVDFFITPIMQKNSDFEYVHLLDERLFLCVPREMTRRGNFEELAIPIEDFTSGISYSKSYRTIDGSMLRDMRFVLLEDGTNVRAISNAVFESWGFMPNKPVEVSQMLTGLNLCISGVGIAFLPESILQYGNFTQMPLIFALDEGISKRSMYACYKKSKYLSGTARAYLEMLKNKLVLK